MLLEKDIQTREVLDWEGLHLFHFQDSTCSQKVRIFLRLKGIRWTSHHVNLARKEHLEPWYMGVNPRGLVPTLVHQGKVIIESNDILEYIESRFVEPALIPVDQAERVHDLLQAENDLHLDIRALTMRFVFPSFLARRPKGDIEKYSQSGSGTVGGKTDAHRLAEIDFWSDFENHREITAEQSIRAFNRFQSQLEKIDLTLAKQRYLLETGVTVVDIAWYIYVRRLISAGYPIRGLHPAVGCWFEELDANPDFREEVPSSGPLALITGVLHFVQRVRGTRLIDLIGERRSKGR